MDGVKDTHHYGSSKRATEEIPALSKKLCLDITKKGLDNTANDMLLLSGISNITLTSDSLTQGSDIDYVSYSLFLKPKNDHKI